MPTPLTYAKINLGNLRRNYRAVCDYTGTTLICVTKADAYGHSAELCVPALYEYGARFFAVANIIEALHLREYLGGNPADILILGATHPDDAPELLEHGFIQTLYSLEYARQLAKKLDRGKLRAHIKIDTGMNRLGFGCADIGDILSVCSEPCFDCEGLFSHLACSDETGEAGMALTAAQFARYMDALKTLENHGVSFKVKHIDNSGGALFHPETRLGYTRAGLVLYGLNPSTEKDLPIKLYPVMDFCTTVTHIHTVRAGESISYGATYTADRDLLTATLAVGYADGFIRSYHNGSVRIRGVDCKLLGRICMDQCVCDVSGVKGIRLGDEALLFGADKPVDELSRLAGTINYESICHVGKRIPRIAITE